MESSTSPDDLAKELASRAEQLEQDIEHHHDRREIFEDLRDVRRSLTELEQEIRDQPDSTLGDAS